MTSSRSGRSDALRFALVFVVVNLHLLRNLTPLYFALYGLIFVFVLCDFVGGRAWRRCRTDLIFAWIIVGVLGFMVSSVLSGLPAAAYGLSRLLFALPVFLAFASYTPDVQALKGHISTMITFFTVAVSTIPLQLVVGPIGWFVETSERGGFGRFGSLLGSLTAIGVVAGSYLVLTQVLDIPKAVPQWAIQVGSVMMSLSKAALGNAAVALGAILVMRRRELSKFAMLAVVGGVGSLTLISTVDSARERVLATLGSFGVESTLQSVNSDSSVQDSAIDRVTRLPRENFEALSDLDSPLVYMVGGGFGMASTGLVPESSSLAPMAHNQFVEFVTVFGFAGGLLMLLVLGATVLRVWRFARIDETKVGQAVLWAFLIWLLNSVFANGTAYHPAAASIMFLAMFVGSARIGVGDIRAQSAKERLVRRDDLRTRL